MAAYRQSKQMQSGVKLGYVQVAGRSNTTGFIANSIPIGTEDFSIEFFGNSFGSGYYDSSIMMNKGVGIYDKRSFYVYNTSPDTNGLSWVLFEKPSSGGLTDDSVSLNWRANEIEEKYLLAITRQGTTVKVYINGELKATKEQSEVKDLGDMQLVIANSSDVGFVRVWNMCLSDDDVTAHYNNGDPMGYVVPKAMRRPETVFPSGVYTESSRTFAVNNAQNTSCIYDNPAINGFSGNYMRFDAVTTVSLYNAFWSNILKRAYPIKVSMEYRCNYDLYEGNIAQAHGRMLATSNEGDAKITSIYYPNSLGGSGLGIAKNDAPDAWLEIRVLSIESVGLLAEYLPQNLMAPRKYKFPLGSFTQSANTFSCSASTTNKIYDNPQANGFSGKFMRFEAITDITLTCSYYIDVVQRAYPIRVTAEYRSNADLIGGYSSGPVVMSKNEGEASIVSFDIPNGISNSEYIRCADNPEAWLEMRILSIEPIPNMATSWLDSAKQLPLSDEYMEPLFQSIGGYDMAANGAPEILYYGPKPDSKGVTLSSTSDPVKSLSLFSGPQIGSGDFTLQIHAYNTDNEEYGDWGYIIGFVGDSETQTKLFILELLENSPYHTCSVTTSIVPGLGSGTPPTVGNDGIQFDMDQQIMFDKDAVLTRSGNTLSVYINGVLKATKQISDISDLSSIAANFRGDIEVFALARVFNKALTAEEVATLHNNGNPDAYVLPASMKQGDQRCVLEWLPANIVPDQSNTSTASEWLDTATVLPEDNVQPKITQSVGGYDGMFQGNPIIVY